MRRFSLRIAITFITFVIGVAAAYLWFIGDRPAPMPIKPEVSYDPPVKPKPVTVAQDRDLSLYDQGGRQGCGIVLISEVPRCKASMKKARAFIWKHFQDKRRGYITVRFGSVDAVSDSHIFIEPDESGAWHVVWRIERVVSMGRSGEIDDVPDIRSIERRRANKSDHEEIGTPILVFRDRDGKEIQTL